MVLTDARKTWMSTAAAVAPRLELRHDPSARTILDGALWPRSRATVTELTNLITGLDGRQMPVTRIMLNPDAWDEHARRISVAGRTVRLGWFTSLDANLLIATTGTDRRVDMLVVAPDTSPASAAAATMATDGDPTLPAAAIMSAVSTRVPGQPHGQPPAEAVWESKGGRITGHRPEGSTVPETGPSVDVNLDAAPQGGHRPGVKPDRAAPAVAQRCAADRPDPHGSRT